MNDDSINIGVNVDDSALKKVINEIERNIQNLSSSLGNLTEHEKKQLDILKQQLETIKQQSNALKEQSSFFSNVVSKMNSDSLQFKMAFARIIQDAPFGILGVANNITFLAEQLAVLREKTIASGKSFSTFKAIGEGVASLFTSPIGLISLFTSLAILLKDTFAPVLEFITEKFIKFTDSIGLTNSKFSNFIDEYKNRVKDLIKITPQKAVPFEPKSLEEINAKISEYEKTIKQLEEYTNKKIESKVFKDKDRRYSPYSGLRFFIEYFFPSDDEIKKLKQRREVLEVELKALKKSLSEFEASQRSILSLDMKAEVEVGKPTTKRTTFDELFVEAPRVTFKDVVAYFKAIRPENVSISEINKLTIYQLEQAIKNITEEIKSTSNEEILAELSERLRLFKAELERKMIEYGLKDPKKSKSIFDKTFSPSQIIKVPPSSSIAAVGLSNQISESEKNFLKQQESIARATQLYAMAREAAANGQTKIANDLIAEANRELLINATPVSDIVQSRLEKQYYNDENTMLGFNFGKSLGESLAQFILFSDSVQEKEKELALKRIEIAKKGNENYLKEQRKSAKRQLREIESMLSRQQITDTEAAEQRQEILETLQRTEEEVSLRRRELALEEERIQRRRSDAIKRAVITNVSNLITEFAFREVLESAAFGFVGAIVAGALITSTVTALRELLLSKITSYAYGGVVKTPTLALIGDAQRSGNRTNEEVIFNERLLTKQAERFAAMVNNMSIVLNGRRLNDELARSERFSSVVKIR
jgi:hypothetical protein